ncbi:YfcE family phosphodiesterase [Anaerotruncus colihominis]|jgi:putative phosphoesterase|uniref:Phosphoesterase n=1 Tax=Anaerotruncus colihominis TaxID=169435 RepID=A0A845RHN9_9FIRM|nr:MULTISPECIES: YfcE family phosphodiesterase [Anaerotruncus]MCI8492515.1 YfcE family phosphodiesterase [Anaerotruncus sp.]NBI79113.1 YfcE family phosphodiesterase [Anaerotruncus colihominis]
MTRIIVVSDTHRDYKSLERLVLMHEKTAGLFIHLGDGAQELAAVKKEYPSVNWLQTPGNCDYTGNAALAGCFTCKKAHIFYTHGHIYYVKYELNALLAAGQEVGANVILYGHTHIPYVKYENGVYLMNPGSLGQPRGNGRTYGVLDVSDSEIVCHISEL